MHKINLNEQELCISYDNGVNAVELSRRFKVSYGTIYNRLKKNNISIRSNEETKRIYKLNIHYFHVIDTPEKAYILGLLSADGYVNTQRGFIRIELIEKDSEILEHIINLIGSDKNIEMIKNRQRTYSRLSIYSRTMSDRLRELGLSQNKTFTLAFPKMKNQLISHYLRGYFDGDGSLGFTKHQGYFSIVSSIIFCKQLQKIISNLFGFTPYLYHNKGTDERVVTLSVGGNQQIVKIMEYLYMNATIFLKRKHDKYVLFKKMVESINLPRLCSVSECSRKHHAKDLCKKHYRLFANASFNIGKPIEYCIIPSIGRFNIDRDILKGSTDTPKGAIL
jgi:intein-encoded DNA endonuclease-like protein